MGHVTGRKRGGTGRRVSGWKGTKWKKKWEKEKVEHDKRKGERGRTEQSVKRKEREPGVGKKI